jgi:hypothetical protein
MIRYTAPIFIALTLASMMTTPILAAKSGPSMVKAAGQFLASLNPAQRKKAEYPFGSDSRKEWNYVPMVRVGLPIKEMSDGQRKLAHALLHAGLSQKGYLKATTIISLENVLRDLEGGNLSRDPELYYFTVWGTPSGTETWGWRVEGHHISLNFTLVKGHLLATTPQFLGSNPAEVMQGPLKGTRPLRLEEDLARELVFSLNESQKKTAILDAKAPADINTGSSRKADIGASKGLPYTQLTKPQKALLEALLEEYARTMPDDLAKERLDRLRKAGMDSIHFAWAGGLERGQGHYYRVQGPTFLVEFDNTQNNANHVHTVWRDFDGDWGEDLLREHYDHDHQPGSHTH